MFPVLNELVSTLCSIVRSTAFLLIIIFELFRVRLELPTCWKRWASIDRLSSLLFRPWSCLRSTYVTSLILRMRGISIAVIWCMQNILIRKLTRSDLSECHTFKKMTVFPSVFWNDEYISCWCICSIFLNISIWKHHEMFDRRFEDCIFSITCFDGAHKWMIEKKIEMSIDD